MEEKELKMKLQQQWKLFTTEVSTIVPNKLVQQEMAFVSVEVIQECTVCVVPAHKKRVWENCLEVEECAAK